MRISEMFGKTLREIPADAETISHQLLLRAGMIQQEAAGVYSHLPLAWRVLRKIENIIREEMDAAGGQELKMPVLQPLEVWLETGRDKAFGAGLFVLTDRRDRKLALGPTHEEIITRLGSRFIQSYHDLPQLLYQIQTKFRDEPRPRAGLIRLREFIMKDLYSFDVDEAGLDISYRKMLQAYQNIYRRCGLPTMKVEADSGAIGGKDSHEFMVITPTGEDELIHCEKCGYAANVEKAQSVREKLPEEMPLPTEEVSTPGMTSIEQVSGFLNVPRSRTLKAVFYVADKELVFVVIRGDIEVNDIKLKNLLHVSDLALAPEGVVRAAGIVAGSASPVGITGVRVVADESVTPGANFVAGGNKPDTHLKNVNYPRDFKADVVADIARAAAGQGCPRCGAVLLSTHGVEVGHVFKLGTVFSSQLGAHYMDASGASRPCVMGCYGIGLDRLISAAIEQNHDERGITFPMPIAPYQVYLCPLYRENTPVKEVTEKLYAELEAAGVEVLLDDREESPGVKFNDADLLGIPLRVTVSPRTLKTSSAEVKKRTAKDFELVPLDGLAGRLKEMVREGMG